MPGSIEGCSSREGMPLAPEDLERGGRCCCCCWLLLAMLLLPAVAGCCCCVSGAAVGVCLLTPAEAWAALNIVACGRPKASCAGERGEGGAALLLLSLKCGDCDWVEEGWEPAGGGCGLLEEASLVSAEKLMVVVLSLGCAPEVLALWIPCRGQGSALGIILSSLSSSLML